MGPIYRPTHIKDTSPRNMINRKTKITGLKTPNTLKSRRTSLNVNLSYTSNTSVLTDDDDANTSLLYDENRTDNTRENTVIEKSKLPVKRNLSLKRRVDVHRSPNATDSGEQTATNIIKPSFVKMVRITSTPVTSRNGNLAVGEMPLSTLMPSENTKRSCALEDVRFPLQGEIFSPNASVVMETSMDITEVQGAAILNLEREVSEDRSDDSSDVVQDTEPAIFDVEERIGAVVIPDSEQDSFNTVRTSLNVNTSLDSRFSSVAKRSLYDPRRIENDEFGNNVIVRNETDHVLSHSVSQSSDENVPMNSIVTTAVIERENSSNNVNHRGNIGEDTTLDLESQRKFNILRNSGNTKSNAGVNPANKSILNFLSDSSSTEELSSQNEDHIDDRPKITNDKDLGIKPVRRGKKKLLRLRRSEMVELSPVTVKIGREKRLVAKKWGKKRNRAAKKNVNKNVETAKKPAPVGSSSEDDTERIDSLPIKEKKVRKLKAKKIIIKKMADVDLWNKMNQNTDNLNESSDDISSALGRTSLDDFAPKYNFSKHKHRSKKPKIVIVATGLPIEQKLLVKRTVTTLGSAKLEKIVTRNTTHVVSKGVRTVNLLRGIVRGCWLVSFEWISKSLEAGEWIDPEDYEITSFSKAVQENRKEKQLFGSAYVSELFLTCGLIHIKEETSTPAQVLKELVRVAGGRVAATPEEAKIIIGRGGLKEVWILDSITNGELQPLDRYCKKKQL